MNSNTEPNPAPKGEQCQCATCGLTFVGERAFDRHRAGNFGLPKSDPDERRCRTVSEMLALGMQLTAAGLWRIPRGAANPTSGLRTEASEARAGMTPADAPIAPLRAPVSPSLRSSAEALT